MLERNLLIAVGFHEHNVIFKMINIRAYDRKSKYNVNNNNDLFSRITLSKPELER